MAVTRITHTTKGFDAINYALSGKPHVKDKFVSGRVMTSSGVNCTVHGCRTQMNAVWKRYGINRPTRRNRRQVQRLIQSFDPKQLSYKNPTDVAQANAIGQKLAYKLYPGRQSIVVTQADNQRHILHNHIITNMLDFRTGKSMTGKETSWQHVQAISDDVIRSYGLNPTANKSMGRTRDGLSIPRSFVHRTDAEYHIQKRNKYSWVADIRNRVYLAGLHSVNMNEYIDQCRKKGVKCDPYRKHEGGIRRDKDGNPVFKKHASFSFMGKDNKVHRIRDRKLGHGFEHDSLMNAFTINATERQQAVEAQREHDRAIKAERQRKAEAQRKERINNERKRISEETHQRLIRLAKDNTNQSKELSENPEPTFRPVSAGDTKPTDAGRNDADQQRRTNTQRQKHDSVLGVFFSHVRRESHRFKLVYVKARIAKIKRRIAKAINRRIAHVRERVQKRIRAVQHAITKRDNQRRAEHQAQQRAKNARIARRHHQQEGFER